MSSNLICIKGEKSSQFYKDWKPWLEETADFYMRFLNNHGGEFSHSPAHEHEQAIVSLFQAGSAKAGYLSLCEVEIERREGGGRCDLWMICGDRQYWFEFKRTNYNPKLSVWGLESSLISAMQQVNSSEYDDKHFGVACIVGATDLMTEDREDFYKGFSGKVDYAFRIGPCDDTGMFIYFNLSGGYN